MRELALRDAATSSITTKMKTEHNEMIPCEYYNNMKLNVMPVCFMEM